MKKHIIFLDLLFYVAVPLLVWKFGREAIGDYYAMLASSVPGILYSIYRFYEVKKVNLTGIYILSTLIIGTMIDFLAGSAMQLLGNKVYYAFFIALFFLFTVLINKPAALYLALDLLELQGSKREPLKELFYRKTPLLVFKLITLAFFLREAVLAAVRIYLIGKYGVDAFDKGIVMRQVISWSFTILTMFGYVYIYSFLEKQQTPPEKPPGTDAV